MTPVLERVDWNMRIARPLHDHPRMPVREVYVHQTAGRDPVQDFPTGDDRPEDAFWALNEYAINGKGYAAVDYSMLVHTGPSLRTTIGVARGEFVPAATLDRNIESKAVCLLGWYGPPDPRYPWTFDNARPPFEQELDAIAEAIVLMIGRGWVHPDAKILGHRDNPTHPNATACPGDWLYAQLPSIRSRVTALLEVPMPVRYFTLIAQPTTLWATSDGLNASRIEPSVMAARGVDHTTVPVLAEVEARRMVFHFGATFDSVR